MKPAVRPDRPGGCDQCASTSDGLSIHPLGSSRRHPSEATGVEVGLPHQECAEQILSFCIARWMARRACAARIAARVSCRSAPWGRGQPQQGGGDGEPAYLLAGSVTVELPRTTTAGSWPVPRTVCDKARAWVASRSGRRSLAVPIPGGSTWMTVAWLPREVASWGKYPWAVEAPPGTSRTRRWPGPTGRVTAPSSCRRRRPCDAVFHAPPTLTAGSTEIALLWRPWIGATTPRQAPWPSAEDEPRTSA
jgi:hypothetical protein